MTSLYASIIRLHALHDGLMAADAGQWANAAFYGLLRQVEPDLAQALHQWNQRKPFTISSLNGLPRSAAARQTKIKAGHECWLRVTTLGQEIFQPFIQHFLEGGARPQILLGPMAFGVSEVLTTPGSHAWAGFTEVSLLQEQSQAEEFLTLEFASPTGFNLSSRLPGPHYALFPLPALVFGSLATKWRDFIAPDLEVAFVEDVASDALVSEFRLQTQTLHWKGRVQKGFTGTCVYDLSELATSERGLLALLADFAFYAGVGGKTTQGMGQCRRLG